MTAFLKTAWHYVIGLAGIGAVSALIAIGSISGTDGLPVLIAIVAALIGGGLAVQGSSSGSMTTVASTIAPAVPPVVNLPQIQSVTSPTTAVQ